MRLKKARIEPLPEAEWDEDVRPALEPTRAIGRGKVPNVLATIARHPKLLKRWNAFGNHVLFKSTLPARDREILILRIGWLCRSEYEFAQHVLIGRRAGLTDADIQRIVDGPGAVGWIPSRPRSSAPPTSCGPTPSSRTPPGPRSAPATPTSSSWTRSSRWASTAWSRWASTPSASSSTRASKASPVGSADLPPLPASGRGPG